VSPNIGEHQAGLEHEVLAESEAGTDIVKFIDQFVDLGSSVDLSPLSDSDAEEEVGIAKDCAAGVEPDKNI
jgi:hypothetical protein